MQLLEEINFWEEGFLDFAEKSDICIFIFLASCLVHSMSRGLRAAAIVCSSLTGDVSVGRVCFSGRKMSVLSPKNTIPFISEKSKRNFINGWLRCN